MEPGTRNRERRHAWYATGAYAAIALLVTWPLARGLARDVAWDLGDSVLVMWAIAWDCEQMLRLLHGHASAALHYFDANIFHPAPLALAYSEHFTAQALQVLPLYAITRNPIVCYNLLFLSTFVLSGLGTFLFVRELTASGIAAFVGGLLFAFAPYRIAQSSHLQVLSAQWMPFALYGFRRYFETVTAQAGPEGSALRRPGMPAWQGGRVVPLAGAAVALVAEYLSCQYYLLYFTPFAAAYVLWEIGQRQLWRNVRMWVQLVTAGLAVAIVTAPFLAPYLALRRAFQLARTRGEVIRYSADVYSYATALRDQPVWGHVATAWPKPEAELFPGVVVLLLAAIGLVFWRDAVTKPGFAEQAHAKPGFFTRLLTSLLALASILYAVAFVTVLLARRITVDVDFMAIRITSANQTLLRGLVAFALLCALSPWTRHRAAAFIRSQGFFALALFVAAWLSLGPQPEALGRPIELFAPYAALYDHVAGFDALRVPARYAMVVVLMLAILGGFGAAVLARRRSTRLALAPLALMCLAEGAVLPFTVNGSQPPVGYAAPEPRLHRAARAPAIYHRVAALPSDAVLAELPLGDPEYDRRAMFYSTVHWRPILNGYSGFSPPHYGDLALSVSDVPRYPVIALNAMRRLGATYALVHESAYLNGAGERTTAALQGQGAAVLFRNGSDVLLKLP